VQRGLPHIIYLEDKELILEEEFSDFLFLVELDCPKELLGEFSLVSLGGVDVGEVLSDLDIILPHQIDDLLHSLLQLLLLGINLLLLSILADELLVLVPVELAEGRLAPLQLVLLLPLLVGQLGSGPDLPHHLLRLTLHRLLPPQPQRVLRS